MEQYELQDQFIVASVILLISAIIVFAIIRSLLLWYWKISHRVTLLEKTLENNQLMLDNIRAIYNINKLQLLEKFGTDQIIEVTEIKTGKVFNPSIVEWVKSYAIEEEYLTEIVPNNT